MSTWYQAHWNKEASRGWYFSSISIVNGYSATQCGRTRKLGLEFLWHNRIFSTGRKSSRFRFQGFQRKVINEAYFLILDQHKFWLKSGRHICRTTTIIRCQTWMRPPYSSKFKNWLVSKCNNNVITYLVDRFMSNYQYEAVIIDTSIHLYCIIAIN